jgi:peptide/nickel transport system permease protein
MTAPILQPDGPPPVVPAAGPQVRSRGGVLAGMRRSLAPIWAARGLSRWLLWSGMGIVAVFIVCAVFAPWIAPFRFDQYQSHGVRFPKYDPPSSTHPFGTSVRAEDVASRVIYGARTALEVVALAVVLSAAVGVFLGLVAGYFGGWLDRVLVLLNDALFAFPYLLLAIVIAFLLSSSIGGGIMTAAIAITVIYIPQYFRVVRSSVLSVREEPYVEAARALGARPRTIISRYLFVNVIQSVPIIATLNAADAILTLAGLDFLGYGIQPTQAAEWGYDLQRAISDTQAGIWWTGLYPGIAIVLLVTGLTLVGEGLNDILNPVLRRRWGVLPRIPARPQTAMAAATPARGKDEIASDEDQQ